MSELRRRNSCNQGLAVIRNSSLIRDFQMFWVLRWTLVREEPVPNTRAVTATWTRKQEQRDRIRDRNDPCANLSVPFSRVLCFYPSPLSLWQEMQHMRCCTEEEAQVLLKHFSQPIWPYPPYLFSSKSISAVQAKLKKGEPDFQDRFLQHSMAL